MHVQDSAAVFSQPNSDGAYSAVDSAAEKSSDCYGITNYNLLKLGE